MKTIEEKPLFTYSNKMLLDRLRKLAAKLGRTPKRREIDKSECCPSSWTYYARFGSLIAALKKAGLKPTRLTRDQAIDA